MATVKRSAAPGLLAAGLEPQDCPGCAAHPLEECAACGARAVIALDCGAHSMSLCRQHYKLVKLLRLQAEAESAKRKAAAKTRKRKSATVAAASAATEAA